MRGGGGGGGGGGVMETGVLREVSYSVFEKKKNQTRGLSKSHPKKGGRPWFSRGPGKNEFGAALGMRGKLLVFSSSSDKRKRQPCAKLWGRALTRHASLGGKRGIWESNIRSRGKEKKCNNKRKNKGM